MDKDQLERLQNAAKINKQLLEEQAELLKKTSDRSAYEEKLLEVKQEELKILNLINIAEGKLTKEAKSLNEEIERRRRILRETVEIEKETESVVTSIAAKFGLVETQTAKFVKKIAEAEDPMAAIVAGLLKATMMAKRLLNPLNVVVLTIGAMAEATKQAVVEVDRVRAGFVGVTADTSDAMRMAERLTLSNLDLAISFGEMSKAQVQLRTEFAQFGFLSDSVRESITLQGAQLQKLGVDAGTTATIMNTLTVSFGQSASEAAATQRQIIGLGQALKIPPAVIARDFAQALPQLAQFGDQAVRVFEELSVAARQAGVSVSDLTGVFGDQFNTFEGAVGAAGRLNQALRSDVFSGMELLMADTAERQRMIKEGLRLSGVEFRNLERYEKLYIANALGIRDVAQAAAILGDSQEQVAMRIGDTSFSMAEMEEMTQASTASTDKLKFVFMQLAVAVTPLVDAFAAIVQGFLDFVEVVPGGMGTIVGVVGTLAGIAAVVGGLMAGTLGGTVLASAGALGALTAGGMGLAAATGVGTRVGDASVSGADVSGVGTRVGDASVSGADVSGIRTRGGGNMIPAADDTVVAAKEGGVLARELKEIKNAIKGMNGGMNGVKFVLEIDGRALETPVKRIIKDYSDGYV
jgi:hypothetical protein